MAAYMWIYVLCILSNAYRYNNDNYVNSLSACVYTLQKVKEQLKEYKENKILHRGPVSFGDDSNGISVTFDPNHVPGWIIDFRDIHCEKV